MSNKTTALSLSLDEQRSRLERRANVIRSRLLRSIDALDHRRHQVQQIGRHAKRLAMPLAGFVVGGMVVAVGALFAVRALLERRRERRLSYRVAKAVASFRAEDKPPFWQEALRRLSLTALSILVSELSKRGAKAVVDGRTLAFLPSHVEGPSRPVIAPEARLLER
jgi:hypothetical protein